MHLLHLRSFSFAYAEWSIAPCNEVMLNNSACTTATTLTTADVRMVTRREHQVLHSASTRTEPCPGVAKALFTVASLAAQVGIVLDQWGRQS